MDYPNILKRKERATSVKSINDESHLDNCTVTELIIMQQFKKDKAKLFPIIPDILKTAETVVCPVNVKF